MLEAGRPRGLNQPHEGGRAAALPHLQVWRRADQPEGVCRPHEGGSERHLLHHRREHRCSVFLALPGDPPQEGHRGAVHDRSHRRVFRAAAEGIRREKVEVYNQGSEGSKGGVTEGGVSGLGCRVGYRK